MSFRSHAFCRNQCAAQSLERDQRRPSRNVTGTLLARGRPFCSLCGLAGSCGSGGRVVFQSNDAPQRQLESHHARARRGHARVSRVCIARAERLASCGCSRRNGRRSRSTSGKRACSSYTTRGTRSRPGRARPTSGPRAARRAAPGPEGGGGHWRRPTARFARVRVPHTSRFFL